MSDNVKKRRPAALAAAIFSAVAFVSLPAGPPGREVEGPGTARAAEAPEITNVTIDEGRALVEENRNNPDFVVVDVRTGAEFMEGHLENALNFDIYSATFKEDIGVLDRAKTYFVYCRSGNRSAAAARIMGELGFTKLYNLNGGYVQWESKGYPVVR
jgi:rhodanese-related sulfurtransferase